MMPVECFEDGAKKLAVEAARKLAAADAASKRCAIAELLRPPGAGTEETVLDGPRRGDMPRRLCTNEAVVQAVCLA